MPLQRVSAGTDPDLDAFERHCHTMKHDRNVTVGMLCATVHAGETVKLSRNREGRGNVTQTFMAMEHCSASTMSRYALVVLLVS